MTTEAKASTLTKAGLVLVTKIRWLGFKAKVRLNMNDKYQVFQAWINQRMKGQLRTEVSALAKRHGTQTYKEIIVKFYSTLKSTHYWALKRLHDYAVIDQSNQSCDLFKAQ